MNKNRKKNSILFEKFSKNAKYNFRNISMRKYNLHSFVLLYVSQPVTI